MQSISLRVLALVAALTLAGCGPKSAQDLLAQARKAIAAQDAKTAQIHLKNVLQLEPQSAEARFLLGKVLLELGDSQGALVELGKASDAGYEVNDVVPLHARALLAARENKKLIERYGQTRLALPAAQSKLVAALAEAHGQQGKFDAMRKLFEQALEIDPKNAAVDGFLARLDADAGKGDEALRRMEVLKKEGRLDAGGWRLLGDLNAQIRQDPKAARRLYEEGLEAFPKAPELHLGLVQLLVSQRDLEGAARQLQTARSRLGMLPGVRFFSALLDMEQGKLDSAFEHVQQLLKTASGDGRVQLLAGQIEFLRDRFLQAESHLTRAVAAPGETLRARLLLAQTYLRMDDPARTLQAMQPLLDEKTRNARVYSLAGEASLQLGESRKAEEFFRRATELDPKDMRSRTLLAMNQVGQGRDSKGLGELRGLADNFESPMADLALVSTFIRKGDSASALAAIDGIDKKLPQRGLAPALRAQVLEAQGKAPEARAQLVQALQRDPKYLPAALHLAKLELAAKQPVKAVEHMAAVVKADPSNVLAQLAWLNTRLQTGEAAPGVLTDLRALVKQSPQVARARAALVRLLVREGDVAGASTAIQDAVAALPQEGDLLELQAEVQVLQREPTLAAATLGKLVALRPNAPEPLLRLAELELQSDKARQALGTVRKALALRPQHPAAMRMQIVLEAELGNVEAARRYVKDMGAVAGLEAQAAAVEGDLETRQQQFDVAVSAYRRALARNPGLPDVAAKLHRTLRLAGKATDADTFAQAWLKEHERDAAFISYLGDVALVANQLPLARQHYDKALQMRPGSPNLLNNLAWVALQSGDAKKAETLAREALKTGPSEAAAHDTLSQALSALGQHEVAIEAQRRAIQLDANPAMRVGLARRLMSAKKNDAARDELLGVQQLGKRYTGQAEVTELLAVLDRKS
jgi:cellulose synthase operon protein C